MSQYAHESCEYGQKKFIAQIELESNMLIVDSYGNES